MTFAITNGRVVDYRVETPQGVDFSGNASGALDRLQVTHDHRLGLRQLMRGLPSAIGIASVKYNAVALLNQ